MPALSALTNTTTLVGTDEFYVLDGLNSRAIVWSALLDAIEAQGAAPASFLASGTIADARVAASNVTQHQAALSITESQISDLGTYSTATGVENNADVTDAANVETAIEAITFTAVSGAAGDEVMIVDATDGGLKAVLWENLPGSGGGISNVVEDTTPQLGGTLDANGQIIDMGVNTVTDTKVGQWDTAFGWGDHAVAGYADLGANVFTGTQDFNGQQVEAYVNNVVTTVSGTLTTTAHSGNVLVTSGNVTVPTTAGFTATIIAGGAHTVTFNGTSAPVMAAGDVMTVVVQSSTVIKASLIAAADQVAFS